VAGIILDGAFSSTFRVMTGIKILHFDKFDNLQRLPNIDCPALFIHGKQDRVVAIRHAFKNQAAHRGPSQEFWVEEAGHNDLIELAHNDYWDTVTRFIRQHSPTTP